MVTPALSENNGATGPDDQGYGPLTARDETLEGSRASSTVTMTVHVVSRREEKDRVTTEHLPR